MYWQQQLSVPLGLLQLLIYVISNCCATACLLQPAIVAAAGAAVLLQPAIVAAAGAALLLQPAIVAAAGAAVLLPWPPCAFGSSS